MLTNDQIDQLHDFCYKHSVRYYDVQVELVDHLANAIEAKMAQNPRLRFEEALHQVHKSFGVCGFAPLVAEKQKAVDRQNRKLLWQLFKEQFRWPKVFLALVIFATSYTLMQVYPILVFTIVAILSLIIVAIFIIVNSFRLQRLEKKSGKEFLLVQFRNMLGFAFIPVNLINVIRLFVPDGERLLTFTGTTGSLIVSALLSCHIVLAVATCQAIAHIEGVVKKNYPTVFSR